MRRKFGNLLIMLGTALILGALALFLYNQQEAAKAESAAETLLEQVTEAIETQETQPPEILPGTPVELLTPEELEMAEIEIDGNRYIGYLTIPKLGLNLPVMTDWSYPQLRIAPCRYTGTVCGNDLVIMAHNYASHFGGLKNLSIGDMVSFVDADGIVHRYQVAALDVLDPTAVEEMTESGFDLTLFTCTYGGASRVTVYCDRT